MRTLKFAIVSCVLILISVFWAREIWDALVQHYEMLARWWKSTKRSYYPWYLWLFAGNAIFFTINHFFDRNKELIKTFTHEKTHFIVDLLFFKRVKSIYAEERNGTVRSYSSGLGIAHLMSSLAPYCFPIYTIPLLAIRCLCEPSYFPIIDTIIGITLGLHITCFAEQIGSYQTDINQYPVWFSYIYIMSFWLFDIMLITMSYIPSLNIFLAFKEIAFDLWNIILIGI